MIPSGFTVRPGRREDAAAVAGLIGALDDVLGVENDTSESDVRSGWAEIELERDTCLVMEDTGRLVGYLELNVRRTPFFDGYVHPDVHGQGLGRALVRLGQELAAGRGERVRTAILAQDEAAASLLASEGFRPTRSFYRMTIELKSEPPQPEVPAGIVLRPLELADAEAFHRATEEAFADHWEWEHETFEAWEQRAMGADDFDPSLWLTALDGEDIAGTLRATGKRFGSGWVTRLPSAGRGGGADSAPRSCLHAFREFCAHGASRASASASTRENPTGATRLYRASGMHVGCADRRLEKAIT